MFQVVDYDDESGVYLGPGHVFDDEDLEYLNDDDVEDLDKKLHETPLTPPLVVDLASGIYLGFDEELTEEKKIIDGCDDDEAKLIEGQKKEDESTEGENNLENQEKAPNIARPLSMRTLLLSKQSSKYKVTSGTEKEGNICFRFLRKFWRKNRPCH